MPRSRWAAFLFCAAVAFYAPASPIAGERAPSTLSADSSSPPFWISASAATGAAGEVDLSVFNPGIREVVRQEAMATKTAAESASTAPCPQVTLVNVSRPLDRGGDTGVIPVLKGTVIAVTPGFFGPTPGSMLTVHVEAPIRGEVSLEAKDVFVPYYAADFTIGSSRFCNAGLPRDGVAFYPRVGDDLLIWCGSVRGRYLPAHDEDLVFGREDRVYAPRDRRMVNSGPPMSSFRDLVNQISGLDRTRMRPEGQP